MNLCNHAWWTWGVTSPGLCVSLAHHYNRWSWRTSSYKLICSMDKSLNPSQSTPAVIPLPQLVTTGTIPFEMESARSTPTDSVSALYRSSLGRNVVYLVPFVAVFVFRKLVKGRENEYGIWPDDSPGRGSGSAPRYLQKYQLMLLFSA